MDLEKKISKHEAMLNYLEAHVKEIAGRTLKFQMAENVDSCISFMTSFSEKVRKRYFRVGAEKEYGFVINITKYFSIEDDDINMQAMNFAQEFADWIDEQDRIKNYPDFGVKCEIKKIEAVQNMPNLAGIDMENMIARYMIQCRVIYFEKER